MELFEFSEWKCMFECINSFCLFYFILFLKECIYECIKLDFFCFIIFEECIYECMKFDFILFCYFWRIHISMHEIWFCFVSFKERIKLWFSFVLLFFNNAYINAWIFYFLLFYYFWRMHIWMYKIRFSFEECILKCMKFYFFEWSFSMQIYVQIFKWFCKWWFFSELFKDNVSKRYIPIFQKRRYVQKIFSIIFKCFKIYVQRNIFNYFFPCLFKKYVQRFFEIYIFYVHWKGF